METQIVLSIEHVLTIIGAFSAVFVCFYKINSKKFDGIEKKFDVVLNELKEMNQRLSSLEIRTSIIENELKNTNQRLSTIEGYLVPKKVFRFEEPHQEEPKEN